MPTNEELLKAKKELIRDIKSIRIQQGHSNTPKSMIDKLQRSLIYKIEKVSVWANSQLTIDKLWLETMRIISGEIKELPENSHMENEINQKLEIFCKKIGHQHIYIASTKSQQAKKIKAGLDEYKKTVYSTYEKAKTNSSEKVLFKSLYDALAKVDLSQNTTTVLATVDNAIKTHQEKANKIAPGIFNTLARLWHNFKHHMGYEKEAYKEKSQKIKEAILLPGESTTEALIKASSNKEEEEVEDEKLNSLNNFSPRS